MVELNRIRGQHLSRAYADARLEAQSELSALKYNPLFIAGMMLYWGEGNAATKNGVVFSNSDPDMIKFYVLFLTRACGIPLAKIKGASAHISGSR